MIMYFSLKFKTSRAGVKKKIDIGSGMDKTDEYDASGVKASSKINLHN